MKWSDQFKVDVTRAWNAGWPRKQIMEEFGLTSGQVAGFRTRASLHTPMGRYRKRNAASDAVTEGRTRYPGTVTSDGDVLKPGAYQAKLGNRVTKGAWKGFKIYALTLEERATCPRDCAVWDRCYGDNLHFARRMKHGPVLEQKLWGELGTLQKRHPRGFVVRLHILGDFMSLEYVALWARALDAFPALRVFGYTARQDAIGEALATLRDNHWARFAIRTSGAATGPRTLVVDTAAHVPAGAILCPAQTGATKNCATCGLCWASTKPVAFVLH